jgi:hypothetical protein
MSMTSGEMNKIAGSSSAPASSINSTPSTSSCRSTFPSTHACIADIPVDIDQVMQIGANEKSISTKEFRVLAVAVRRSNAALRLLGGNG